MLVLSRKRTEMINIGEDIVITVLHTSTGSVKLGIQAPAHVRVLRAELEDRPVVDAKSPTPALENQEPHPPVFSADRYLEPQAVEYENQTLVMMAN